VTTVSAIIVVSFEDPVAVRSTVGSLRAQTRPPDEIVVVDNHPDALVSTALADLEIRAVRAPRNLGYPPAVNLGARHASGDWLLCLNPDASADPGCLEALLDAADERTAIVGAQVLLPDGRCNAGDNPVHVSGLSWAGRLGDEREDGPPRDTAATSGAAVLMRRADFERLGGFHDSFFLYVDDTDLAWRARLAGRRVRYVPEALVTHEYEFHKGAHKWFWLERNRLFMVLCNYAAVTLALLAPLLLATEAAVVLRAAREGWLREKARAWRALARDRRALREARARTQAARVVPDAEILRAMTGRIDSPVLDNPVLRAASPVMDAYRRAVIAALRLAR
jgi:GT2 family glycosyltransferase